MGRNMEAKDMDLDLELKEVEVKPETVEAVAKKSEVKETVKSFKSEDYISCLRNETIIVRHVPKESGMITNPKHVFYGGIAENASRVFTVPLLEKGNQYVNILTNEEKTCLEEAMGLDDNALSIYRKVNNYWDNYTVRLTKSDTYLDLSNPEDYIRWKVLKANKDYIAGSLEELQSNPKATYQYVLISENEETKVANKQMSSIMQAYMEFGRIQDDLDTLRVVIESIDGRPISSATKAEFLSAQINKLIQANPRLFLDVVTDKYLSHKVFLKKALEKGLVYKRGTFFYLRDDNSPMCEEGEEPTFAMAAKYLAAPKHQGIKLALEAKLKV